MVSVSANLMDSRFYLASGNGDEVFHRLDSVAPAFPHLSITGTGTLDPGTEWVFDTWLRGWSASKARRLRRQIKTRSRGRK